MTINYMTAGGNTSYGLDYKGGVNEDVMQQIFDISKIKLPLTQRIGTSTHARSYYEWTMRRLATGVATNKIIDGDDPTTSDERFGLRVGNYSQISTKNLRISERVSEVDAVGGDEVARQIMDRGDELRRDVETAMLANNASVQDTGHGGTAGQSAGLCAYLVNKTVDAAFSTNANHIVNLGADSSRGGSSSTLGGFNTSTKNVDAATLIATGVKFTEASVRDTIQNLYSGGCDPTVFMSSPAVIRKMSEYMFTSSARIASIINQGGDVAEKRIAQGSVNVFVTDFGTLDLVANRFMTTVTDGTHTCSVAYIMDPSYLNLSFLGGYRVTPLAKTGLSNNWLMRADWGLTVKNFEALGAILDIDATQAVTAT